MPLIVRGPGVPEGRTLTTWSSTTTSPRPSPTSKGQNASLRGRTLARAATGRRPDARRRLAPALRPGRRRGAERGGQPPFVTESTVAPLLTGDPLPNNWRRTSAASAQLSEEWGRPWMKALRTNNYLYVEYKTGEHELYDLRTDPYELRNKYETASPDLKQRLEAQLDALRKCAAEECRAAEGGEPEESSLQLQPKTGAEAEALTSCRVLCPAVAVRRGVLLSRPPP